MNQDLYGVNNFTDPEGPRNLIEDYSVPFRSIFNQEGIIDGLIITATSPASTSINISAGNFVIDCRDGAFLIFRLKTAISNLSVPNTGAAKYYLVVAKVNTTLSTVAVAVVEGTTGQDPALTEADGVYYLVLGRIQKTATVNVTSGEILQDGTTITNNATPEVIYNSSKVNTPAVNYPLTYSNLDYTLGLAYIPEQVYHVRDYGAVGDGVTDDKTHIQNAFAAATAAGGGIVQLDGLQYATSNQLQVPDNVWFRGTGPASQLVPTASSDGFVFVNMLNVVHAQVTDMMVDGMVASRSNTHISGGVFINDSSYCRIARCITTDLGIIPMGDNGGNHMAINAFEGEGDSKGNIIEDNYCIDPNAQSGFGIRLFTDWSLLINDTDYTTFVSNNIIRNNRLEGFNWNVIEVAGPATLHNTIQGNTASSTYAVSGIEADKGASYNQYIGNHVDGMGGVLVVEPGTPISGYRCQGTVNNGSAPLFPTRYARGNSFAGNTVKNMAQYGTDTAAGMIVYYAQDTSITNLSVRDITPTTADITDLNVAGIYISTADRTTISGSLFRNVQTGIYVVNPVVGLSISGNIFDVNEYGYFDNNSSQAIQDVTIADNVFEGGAVSVRVSQTLNFNIHGNICSNFSAEAIQVQTSSSVGVVFGNSIYNPSGSKVGIRLSGADQMAWGNFLYNATITSTSGNENLRNTIFGNHSNISGTLAGNITYSDIVPASGSWKQSDIVYQLSPTSGSYVGWINVTTGSPGTWRKFGIILDANDLIPAAFIRLDQISVPTADVSMNSHKITNLTDPSSAQDAATKNYVDTVSQGLDVKTSVRAATTANITLSGAQTIDGVSVIAGNRVLTKNQTTASENGIYVAASGSWTRATDADTSAKVTSGMFTFVTEGTVNGNYGFILTTADPITLGSTNLTFTEFSGLGEISVSAELTKTGNTLSITPAGVTYAMLQNMTTNRLHGRSTAGSGSVEEITLGSGLTLSAGSLTNNLTVGVSGGQNIYGDTASAGLLTIYATSHATRGTVYIEADLRLDYNSTTAPVDFTTQISSHKLIFETNNWTGSITQLNNWSMQSVPRTTSNSTDFHLQWNGSDIVKINQAGSTTWLGAQFTLAASQSSTSAPGNMAYIVENTNTTVGNFETYAARNANAMDVGYLTFKNQSHSVTVGKADFGLWLANGAAATQKIWVLSTGYVGIGISPTSMIHTQETQDISGSAVTDGYSGGMTIDSRYDGAHAVTRHNYLNLLNPTLTTSATITDAVVFRFDAAAGTHKAVDAGTTKITLSPDAWFKNNLNGTIYYTPMYLSKTT